MLAASGGPGSVSGKAWRNIVSASPAVLRGHSRPVLFCRASTARTYESKPAFGHAVAAVWAKAGLEVQVRRHSTRKGPQVRSRAPARRVSHASIARSAIGSLSAAHRTPPQGVRHIRERLAGRFAIGFDFIQQTVRCLAPPSSSCAPPDPLPECHWAFVSRGHPHRLGHVYSRPCLSSIKPIAARQPEPHFGDGHNCVGAKGLGDRGPRRPPAAFHSD